MEEEVMENHWKVYDPLYIVVHDATAEHRSVAALQVTAQPSPPHLATPIGVVIEGVGSLALTPVQSAALRALLERAEHDLASGADGVSGGLG